MANPQTPQLTGAFLVGVGLATLAVALPFTGIAVGLIEATEPIHWAMRVFLFVFTAPFLLIGLAITAGGCKAVIDEAVPGESSTLARLPRFVLRQITRPRHIVGAIPIAFVLTQYYLVINTGEGLFGVGEPLLRRGLLLEFIAIHAGGFIGAVLIIPGTTSKLRALRYGLFAALAAMYLLIGFAQGLDAGLFLAYLVALKIGPLIGSEEDFMVRVMAWVRWAFGMAVFMGVITIFGGPESLQAGLAYWSTLLVGELLGMNDAELAVPDAPDSVDG